VGVFFLNTVYNKRCEHQAWTDRWTGSARRATDAYCTGTETTDLCFGVCRQKKA